MSDRWATFDCYGTLIDWNGGIRRELARIFGEERPTEQLARYHEVEPRDPGGRPRALATARCWHRRSSGSGAPARRNAARSATRCRPGSRSPRCRPRSRRRSARGWKLAILSNTDRDFIGASKARLGIPFDETIVASEIGSYKPGHRHWSEFFARTHADRDRHVHVAASHFHDIVPATELGLRTVWINRLGETGDPPPTRELPDLNGLADVLDELVPA